MVKSETTEEAWKRRALEAEGKLENSMKRSVELINEIEAKNRTIAVLIAAGHLDKSKLEQATEIAGGIN